MWNLWGGGNAHTRHSKHKIADVRETNNKTREHRTCRKPSEQSIVYQHLKPRGDVITPSSLTAFDRHHNDGVSGYISEIYQYSIGQQTPTALAGKTRASCYAETVRDHRTVARTDIRGATSGQFATSLGRSKLDVGRPWEVKDRKAVPGCPDSWKSPPQSKSTIHNSHYQKHSPAYVPQKYHTPNSHGAEDDRYFTDLQHQCARGSPKKSPNSKIPNHTYKTNGFTTYLTEKELQRSTKSSALHMDKYNPKKSVPDRSRDYMAVDGEHNDVTSWTNLWPELQSERTLESERHSNAMNDSVRNVEGVLNAPSTNHVGRSPHVSVWGDGNAKGVHHPVRVTENVFDLTNSLSSSGFHISSLDGSTRSVEPSVQHQSEQARRYQIEQPDIQLFDLVEDVTRPTATPDSRDNGRRLAVDRWVSKTLAQLTRSIPSSHPMSNSGYLASDQNVSGPSTSDNHLTDSVLPPLHANHSSNSVQVSEHEVNISQPATASNKPLYVQQTASKREAVGVLI